MSDRVSVGVPALDEILGGGIAPGSLVVIGGGPGTGKTIMAQQICFRNASAERKATYYTTLSEPHSKLIQHLKPFEFFDDGALGVSIDFFNAVSFIQEKGLKGFSDEVARAAFETHPSVIVVDSAKALAEIGGAEPLRALVYEVSSRVAHTDAVLVFVGEYEESEMTTAPEFAVADVIIFLGNDQQDGSGTRTLRVLKQRGSDYLAGPHSFKITTAGIDVFPRFEALWARRDGPGAGRVSSGVAGLDEMMGGGIPAGSQTLVSGPSGAGKTVLGLHFVKEGVARGEACLYVTFQESQSQLLRKAAAFGWKLEDAVASGLLRISSLQPVEMGLDAVGAGLREALSSSPAARVVVDSIGDIGHAARFGDRYADYVWALVELFRSIGATGLLTSETTAFGPSFELAKGLSFIFDNVLLLRYAELESEIRRALGVVKMRDSEHVKTLVEFEVNKKGFEVVGKFQGLRGVLTGAPLRTEEKFREFFER